MKDPIRATGGPPTPTSCNLEPNTLSARPKHVVKQGVKQIVEIGSLEQLRGKYRELVVDKRR